MTNISTLDYVEDFIISKTITDRMWTLNFTLDKDEAPAPLIGIRAFATDYADVEHCLFVGFVPGANYIRQSANNKVNITAYDHSWYLTAQYVPKSHWEWDITGNSGDSFVFDMCGGDDWENITGTHYPHDQFSQCINPGTMISDPKTTKMEAIEELCTTCDNMWWTDFPEWLGVRITQAYYMPYGNIDSYLPAKVTFTSPSDYVIDQKINIDIKEEYNRVIVYGTNPITGDWYTKTEEYSAVTAGELEPIEFVYSDAKLTTQAKVDAKALALYDIVSTTSARTYIATLTNRYDLRLLQKVKFVGYDEIDEVDMRITAISYQRVLNQDRVVISFTADQSFANFRLFARCTIDDPITTQQQVIENAVTKLANIEVGTVTAVNGNEATITLERSGNSIKARILS